jgi:putative addiction module killer protein
VYEILKTDEFDKWLRKLRDKRAVAKILLRVQRIEEQGNFGDCESVGGEIRELRIHYAKGYRVYLSQQDKQIVLLLNGGIKTSQTRDIKKAQSILKSYKSQK